MTRMSCDGLPAIGFEILLRYCVVSGQTDFEGIPAIGFEILLRY